MYIRKNHLAVNGDTEEIYEVISENGRTVEWFGTEAELTEMLGTGDWSCGDTVVTHGDGLVLAA